MTSETESHMPRILDEAPDFEATSTHGVLHLSDFTNKGKWVMLFSHPADFTPICSTEFVAFARRSTEFEKRNVQMIGLSIDGVNSHIAWARDMEQHCGVEITFPVIADSNRKIARLYGMLHEAASDTATVRAVFAIDPKRRIRAILYYPMQLGRSVDELLRVFDGLQTIDRDKVSTPADWVPGQPVVVAAPGTLEGARQRAKAEDKDLNVKTWYLATKEDAPAAS